MYLFKNFDVLLEGFSKLRACFAHRSGTPTHLPSRSPSHGVGSGRGQNHADLNPEHCKLHRRL